VAPMTMGHLAAGNSAAAGATVTPTVSVIIPVWNVEPYLRECLESVVTQSIGLERLEVIAVDDGSTDASGALLDEYAERYPQVAVIHEPNSGGPGRPRNVGLDRASGTYVFFLDADDYLGREALERLVAMAERNGTDIVLARMVGVGGRLVPTRAFLRTRARASLDEVYSTLTVLKLFRRALIERLGLRFQEGLAGGEDGPFTARAYFEASGISVVADYDCYYCRLRPGSQTGRGERDDLLEFLARIGERMELLAQHSAPGIRRDRMMARHVADVVRPFRGGWLALEPEERGRAFDAASALLARWHTERIQRVLDPWSGLRAYCLNRGLAPELEDIVACSARRAYANAVMEGARVFAGYPHFRDSAGIPDSCFEITDRTTLHQHVTRATVTGGTMHLAGEAYLGLLGGTTTIVLRRGRRGPALLFPTASSPTPGLGDRHDAYPDAGFAAAIDLATAADGGPLRAGSWDILLSVGTDRVRRTARLRPPAGAGATAPAAGASAPGAGASAPGAGGASPVTGDSPPGVAPPGVAPLGAVYATRAGPLRLRVGPPSRATNLVERGEAAIGGIRHRYRRLLHDLRRLRRLRPWAP